MAEMAAKAHEISLEAGSKMASAMRDVVGAAAGISAFAIESARDLVNYMVRRGQMSQEEATKLLKEVEEAHAKRPKVDIPKRSEVPAKSEIRMLKDPVPAKPEHSAAPPSRLVDRGPGKPAIKTGAPVKPAAPAAKAAPAKAAPPEKKPAVAKAPAAKAPAKPAAVAKKATKKK
jgi:polyhydroxyalkanoate synthesis regulator phasin